MTARKAAATGVALVLMISSATAAQKPPAIRPLGPIVRVTTEPLVSVATAVALSDGRVYVNDIVSRRVLLFDSTLSHAQVVADSTSVTAKAYGGRAGTLIAYRTDTALFMDPASSSMPVLSPAGKIVRVLGMPQIGSRPFLVGQAFYTPGFDARGRLVYFVPAIGRPLLPAPAGRHTVTDMQDSAFIVGFVIAARTIDTLSSFRAPRLKLKLEREDERILSFEVTPDVLPQVDDWAVCPDGVLAVVRGRDYHVDWLSGDGKWSSTPRMPFDWQHLDDAQKTTLIDSTMTTTKARRDSMDAARASAGPPAAGGGGGRGGGARDGGAGGGGATAPPPQFIDGRPALGDLPDYRPPFLRGSVHADADGNLWIRTTTMVNGLPVYDIVNRRGEVTDRVQLPAFRAIAGFGPGVVYMAVKDEAGIVHLERARVK